MSVTRPRGPLPARVYWRRRLVLLAVVLAVVLGITRLFGGGSEEDSQPAARRASAESPAASPSAVSTADARVADDRESGAPAGSRKRDAVRTPLAEPSGPCQDSDVKVVPAMQRNAYAGGTVRLTLELSTFESPACNWEVSADTVAVRLTSGSDRIWSSQDCPSAVPQEPVVLRDRDPVLVDVMWSGRRSDPDCSSGTLWAEPGYYHVSAAAMGSEPKTEQFRLVPPAPVTITPTPTPKADRPDDDRRDADRPEADGAEAEDNDDEAATSRRPRAGRTGSG